MNGTKKIDGKVVAIAALSALLVLGLIAALVFVIAGKQQTGGAVTSQPQAVTGTQQVSAAAAPGAGTTHTESGGSSESHSAPGSAPTSTPAAPSTVDPAPILLTSLSGSSADAASQDSGVFPVAGTGRLVARVTVHAIDGSTGPRLEASFVQAGHSPASGGGCFTVWDEMTGHTYVLAEYVAGNYFLHLNATNCTYSVTLELQI
jgi:hypothetical protein